MMMKYKREKTLKRKLIDEYLVEWDDRYSDWEYDINHSEDNLYYDNCTYYKISHTIERELIMRRNPSPTNRFNRRNIIKYDVVDMQSFYDINTLRDRKISEILGENKIDYSNTIENILKEKQNV